MAKTISQKQCRSRQKTTLQKDALSQYLFHSTSRAILHKLIIL